MSDYLYTHVTRLELTADSGVSSRLLMGKATVSSANGDPSTQPLLPPAGGERQVQVAAKAGGVSIGTAGASCSIAWPSAMPTGIAWRRKISYNMLAKHQTSMSSLS